MNEGEFSIGDLRAENRELAATVARQEKTIHELEARLPPRLDAATIWKEWKVEHLYDLMYYEGPLLSLFMHDAGDGRIDLFLMKWGNNLDDRTLWCVVPVSMKTVFTYMEKEITLYEVLTNPLGGKAYLVDCLDGDKSEFRGEVDAENIPDFFLPQKGTYYSGHSG